MRAHTHEDLNLDRVACLSRRPPREMPVTIGMSEDELNGVAAFCARIARALAAFSTRAISEN